MRSVTVAAMVLLVSTAIGAEVLPATVNGQPDSMSAQEWATHVAWARYSTLDSRASSDYVSEADAVRAMIAHHQDAIDAAVEYLPFASTPNLVAFAERIERGQSEQVDQMSTFLVELGEAVDGGVWDQMFCDLSTTGTDEAFLETMIAHHRAAVEMYDAYVSDGSISDAEMGLLMRRIGLGQIGEIEWMEQQLALLATAPGN